MSGRNEREAWRAFVDPIRRAVGAVDLVARLQERRFANGIRHLATAPSGIAFGTLTLSFSFQMEAPLSPRGS